MQKLIGKRVAIWTDGEYGLSKGRTGEVVGIFRPKMFDVLIDDGQAENCTQHGLRSFFESELYFPDHPLAYNQPCFNQ